MTTRLNKRLGSRDFDRKLIKVRKYGGKYAVMHKDSLIVTADNKLAQDHKGEATQMKRILTGCFLLLLLVGFMAGCGSGGGTHFSDAGLTVISTDPANGDTDVPTNRKITATFSEPIDPDKITTATFTLEQGGTPVSGTVDCVGRVAIFTPAGNLAPATIYTATIAGGANKSKCNGLEEDYTWSFTTGQGADDNAPTVISTDPDDEATGVPINRAIAATFSEAMDPLTITTATFTVQDTTAAVAVIGAVTYDAINHIAIFTPTSNLGADHSFDATITIGAEDLAGNPLASNEVWSFRTGTAAAAGPEPVILGTLLGEFNILAGSAVTNTDTLINPTTIEGLVGVHPGSAVSGLPTAAVPAGQIHAGDTVAAAAKVALLAAYNDAVSRSEDAISLPGNLGGLTLTPGLYVNSSSTGISGTGTNAILTLDAQGDENAVWIFKMGSTLTTTTGTSIVLANNAQAKNIFWQVGSSATLGTNSIFKGNILAAISITLTTGVNLEGRALTRTGAVTLDKNTITLPLP